MSKALITGGAGFIGYHLAKLLSDGGHEVVLVDDLSRGVRDPDLEQLCANPAVRLLEQDLLAAGALDELGDDFNYVYHFAAIIGVAHVTRRPYAVLSDNAALLLHAHRFARRQRVLRRFIFASTSEVYAGTLAHFGLAIPTPEESALAVMDLRSPRGSYMLSKIHGEALCHHSGLPFTIIRPHNFYGPRMGLSHVIPELLKRVHDAGGGDSLQVFSVGHTRTFCYVGDAVEWIRRLAESAGGAGGTFNVGCQVPEIAMGDLARLVVRVTGRNLEIVPGPDAPGSPRRRCPDTTRAVNVTGYRARVGLDEGVRRTYEWYRDRIFKGGSISAV